VIKPEVVVKPEDTRIAVVVDQWRIRRHARPIKAKRLRDKVNIPAASYYRLDN